MLSLAHHIERLVEKGQIRDYAEAAKALGLTRARLTQVMRMLLLAPGIQAALLIGELRISERTLRHVVVMPEWSSQELLILQ